MSDKATRAAERLFALRLDGGSIEALNDDEVPRGLDEAYAIQDAMIAMANREIIGWKVGASAPEIQARLGLDAPFAGPIFADMLYPSPARPAATIHTHRVIESEFALRLGQDLNLQNETCTPEQASAAIATVAAGMEIVGHGFSKPMGGHILSRIGDFGVNEGGVIGPERKVDPDALAALTNHVVTLSIDDKEVASGTGALALGNPVNSVSWLAGHLANRPYNLNAGMVVLTGTVTGMRPLDIGSQAIADFGDFGVIDLQFS